MYFILRFWSLLMLVAMMLGTLYVHEYIEYDTKNEKFSLMFLEPFTAAAIFFLYGIKNKSVENPRDGFIGVEFDRGE